jgi:hypothetical protein
MSFFGRKAALAVGTACLVFLPVGLHANVVTVTVGNGDTGNCYPFMCNDSGQSSGPSLEYQQVYASSAFPGSIVISAVTFYQYPGTPEVVVNGNYDISFSTTSAPVGGLSGTLANNVGSNSATFYNGSLGGAFSGSFTITGTPFTYNPAGGNLLMDVYVTNQAIVPNGSGNGYNAADDSGSATSRVYAFDGSGVGNVDGTGLVTTFSGTNTPEPFMILPLGAGILGLLAASKRLRAKA